MVSILKRHKIKPHWMFALDSLVRNAVQQSVNVLIPEPEVGESAVDHLEFPPFEVRKLVNSFKKYLVFKIKICISDWSDFFQYPSF